MKTNINVWFDIEIPKGYIFDRFGIPKEGDYYISNEEKGLVEQVKSTHMHITSKIVVKKKEVFPFLFQLVKDEYPYVDDTRVKEFLETVEKVYEVDKDSGKYIINLALFEDERTRGEASFTICGQLVNMFDWDCYMGSSHWSRVQYDITGGYNKYRC